MGRSDEATPAHLFRLVSAVDSVFTAVFLWVLISGNKTAVTFSVNSLLTYSSTSKCRFLHFAQLKISLESLFSIYLKHAFVLSF